MPDNLTERPKPPRAEIAKFAGFTGFCGRAPIPGPYSVLLVRRRTGGRELAHVLILGTHQPWKCGSRNPENAKRWVEAQFKEKLEDWKPYEEPRSSAS